MKMSKLTAAYIAGFVDGEGHISIYPYVRKDRVGNPVYYKATFKVSNTNKEIIEWFKASFGGWIYTQNKKAYQKILYTWSLDAKTAEEVLRIIYPYLKIKRRQCELVLERIGLRYKQGMGPIKDDTIQTRVLEIYNELRKLNERGNPLYAERLSEVTRKGSDSLILQEKKLQEESPKSLSPI